MTQCENSFSTLTQTAMICFASINTIIGTVSLIGNSLVFYIFYKNENLRNRSSYCLLSLALTDLLVGAVLEPIYVTQILLTVARLNCTLISIRRFLSALLLGASMSSIALISYDRYVHLSKTNQYTLFMTRRKIKILVVICWVLPGISPILTKVSSGRGIFSGVIFIYTFCMLVIILTSYFLIVRIVKRKESQVNQMNLANPNGRDVKVSFRSSRNAVKVSKAVAYVILCFLAFNAPLSIYLGVVAYGFLSSNGLSWLTAKQEDIFYLSVMTVSLANSTINAPIYYFRIPGFRQKINQQLRMFLGNPLQRTNISTERETQPET